MRPWLLPIFLPTLISAATFPCGPSFTPCGVRAFGVRTATRESHPFKDRRDSRKNEAEKLISNDKLVQAVREAAEGVATLNKTEKDLLKNLGASSFSAAELSWSKFSRTDKFSKNISNSAFELLATTKKLVGSVPLRILESLPLDHLYESGVLKPCSSKRKEPCKPSKYRSFSGECNNVLRHQNGAVYQPFSRVLKPDYADDVDAPRIGASGNPLPLATTVSQLFTPTRKTHSTCSLMLAQWASFIYDDMAQVAGNQLSKNGYDRNDDQLPFPCCKSGSNHPECFPITSNRTTDSCISYTRSLPVPSENCTLGPREQGNLATGFLDGSQIYGTNDNIANRLRSFNNGKLSVRPLPGSRQSLPAAALDGEVDCRSRNSAHPCFLAGSHRINFLPSNAAIYTLWIRQHNYIADQLKEINRHWDDERLFQEARRLVIAQMQHITFNEFLPMLIGKEELNRQRLRPQHHGYDSGYDIKFEAPSLNSFAAAAGQFFMTLLPEDVVAMNPDSTVRQRDALVQVYNDPSMLYQRGRVEAIVRGLLRMPIAKPGLHLASHLKRTFARVGSTGMDLAAMVIQMGRDHGIPGFLAWRRACNLENIQSFSALQAIMRDSVNMTDLSKIYEVPDDIDLFVGGLAEKPQAGALLGPTLSCIFSKQMERVKKSDRFWYENFVFPSSFSDDQLKEIRKTTLARIICDNGDGLDDVQQHVFSLPDEYGNCPTACSASIIDKINFSAWRDSEPQKVLPITKATIEKAIRLGIEQFTRLQEAEGKRISRDPVSSSPSAVFSHAALMAPKRQSLEIARTAGVLSEATRVLVSGKGLDLNERLPSELDVKTLQTLLPNIDVESVVGNFTPFLGRDPLPKDQCLPRPLPCDHTSKYRTYSGWCNNIKYPHYGNSFEGMRRLLNPAYDDGFDKPRTKSTRGRELPSARTVSNAVHNDAPVFHVKFSHMLMQFGQILDHDMMHSPISRGPNNTILNCSRCDSYESISVHCFPIKIERGDPFFPERHSDGTPRCMPFARSLLAQLTLGYRNQLNQLTSFLDASSVYGSTECEVNRLRLFSLGRLNFTDLGFNKEALPQGIQERDCRSILGSPSKRCFMAGDERNNEQPGLTVIHTILLREHNRIADELHRLNNFWTDEQLFQEARRINIAKLQHIIYNEWLPIVLGCDTMAKFDLMPRRNAYFEGYDPTCDASISQEMSTAAFRFGHTLIRAKFPRMNENFVNMTDAVNLKDHFSNPTPIYERNAGHLESMLMGLLGANSMAFDRHITDAVRNHLFAKPGGPLTGIDLPAVNIQRGRDHGIPGYNAYRPMAGLRKARSFEDLRDTMDFSAVAALKSVYDHVDDIDLFPGIMSEKPLKGALVGPSLAFLIGEQMQRLKKCDRFYYENNNANTRFTPDQLEEIRKSSFSKMICSNSEYANKIQPNAFLMPDDLTNAPMSCSELQDTDLSAWLDRSFCVVDNRVINLGRTKRVKPCVTCTCTSEGTECRSVAIDRCDQLLSDFPASEIAKDPVCMIQCASSFLQRLRA